MSSRVELILETTTGNHGQKPLDKFYSEFKQFSSTLIKDIVQFWGKIIVKTTSGINKTKTSLKSNINQQQFKVMKTENQSNETDAKKILLRRKFKNLLTWNMSEWM